MNELIVAAIAGGAIAAVLRFLEFLISRNSAKKADDNMVATAARTLVEPLRAELENYQRQASEAEKRALAAERRSQVYLGVIYAHLAVCTSREDLQQRLDKS